MHLGFHWRENTGTNWIHLIISLRRFLLIVPQFAQGAEFIVKIVNLDNLFAFLEESYAIPKELVENRKVHY